MYRSTAPRKIAPKPAPTARPALEPSLGPVDGFREAVAVAEDADFGVVDGVEDIEDVDDAIEVEGVDSMIVDEYSAKW